MPRRVWLVIASFCLLTVFGCGKENYNKRLARTLEKMEKDRRIKKNLMEAPNDKKFTDLNIYVRPPKDEVYAKAGQLPIGEGQFDLDASFNDKVDATMHLLARVKKQKKAPTKGAPPPPPPVARGAFKAEVLGVLANVFPSDALLNPKFTPDKKFERLMFTSNDKEVKLYTYKDSDYEVALIFVYDPKLKGPLSSKIELCLDAFATGQTAAKMFSGGNPDEETEGPVVPM